MDKIAVGGIADRNNILPIGGDPFACGARPAIPRRIFPEKKRGKIKCTYVDIVPTDERGKHWNGVLALLALFTVTAVAIASIVANVSDN